MNTASLFLRLKALFNSTRLLADDGVIIQYNNPRTYFQEQLEPSGERLTILAPEDSGQYGVEIDIVWEGITWFKDKGKPTSIVGLTVS